MEDFDSNCVYDVIVVGTGMLKVLFFYQCILYYLWYKHLILLPDGLMFHF